MNITIFGSGYVGLVTGACLADVGNNVLCVDIDQEKTDKLKKGIIPIYEPGLESLIKRSMDNGLIDFTTDIPMAVNHAELQFIAVGTPPDEDGSADLQYVLAVANSIAKNMQQPKIVIDKSTVPVGTGEQVRKEVERVLEVRDEQIDFHIVSNPEFLKEGAAISDFMKPDRIIIGTDSDYALDVMRELYAPFSRNHDKLISMDIRSAELTKYAANAMLATKISFMNELANIAENVGADIEQVRMGIGSDPRIGYHFIYPGCGYGGSCFPKDVKALEKSAKDSGVNAVVLSAVEARNESQKKVLFNKINNYFQGKLKGKTIALWGLAFKPNTDDMRDAPSRVLMEALWDAGATVKAHDPEAMEECQRIYGDRSDLVYCDNHYDALDGSDVLAICTEWKTYRSPDFDFIRANLNNPVIFDGRNLYDPKVTNSHGLEVFSIGRPLA